MAMRLTAPVSVECVKQEGKSRYTFSAAALHPLRLPARGSMPPVRILWHDGMKSQPDVQGVPAGEILGDKDINGSLFKGSKGLVATACYGERKRLVPAEKMKDYKLPTQLLTRSPGHYGDWIRTCTGGERSCSDFSVAGPLVQWVLLCVIAMKSEGKLEWDAAKGRFTNNSDPNMYLKTKVRKGWKFA